MNVTQTLQKWYANNKRDLPWRHTSSPYKIWLSEIILQQTRVQQGLDYYHNFIDRFPDVISLANAEEDLIMKFWQGLGYYSRARNLHATAKNIFKNYNGEFPESYEEILKLKGVGEYTASAIASFAYNLPHAVVDGNVYRVLSRLYNINVPIDSGEGKKLFKNRANKLLDKKNPAIHNQAIMEFGALQCLPRNPDCLVCPLLLVCRSQKSNTVNSLPVKLIKIKKRTRYLNYFIVEDGDHTYINKRSGKDIWQSLYEFPLIEKSKKYSAERLLADEELLSWFDSSGVQVDHISSEKIHQLSHQKLHCQFFILKGEFISKGKFKEIKTDELVDFAFPQVIEIFLKEKYYSE